MKLAKNEFLEGVVKKLPAGSDVSINTLRMRLLAYPSSMETTDMADLSKVQEEEGGKGSGISRISRKPRGSNSSEKRCR